jgi:hypothetical protein
VRVLTAFGDGRSTWTPFRALRSIIMQTPFTAEQFIDVFRRYNETVWPAQIALSALALFAVFAAYRANVRRSWHWAQGALLLLMVLWLWTGVVYHKLFFTTLTEAGEVFGSLFIAEAGLLLIAALQSGSAFRGASRGSIVVGLTLIAYALVLYPLIGIAFGHHYPATPTFGTPCPTTIFTFGVFCLLPTVVPRFTLAIPVVWASLGSYAAVAFGIRQDIGLVIAAIVAIVAIYRDTRRNAAQLSAAPAIPIANRSM